MMDPTKMKVPQLKAELVARGLDTKGIKSLLIERLKAHIAEEQEREKQQLFAETAENIASTSLPVEDAPVASRASSKTPKKNSSKGVAKSLKQQEKGLEFNDLLPDLSPVSGCEVIQTPRNIDHVNLDIESGDDFGEDEQLLKVENIFHENDAKPNICPTEDVAEGEDSANEIVISYTDEKTMKAVNTEPLDNQNEQIEDVAKENSVEDDRKLSVEEENVNEIIEEPEATTETEAIEPEAIQSEAIESEAIESEATESEAIESEATESEAIESEAIKSEAIESEAIESEAIESEAIESEAIESEAIESEAIESEAIETEAIESENNANEEAGTAMDVSDQKSNDQSERITQKRTRSVSSDDSPRRKLPRTDQTVEPIISFTVEEDEPEYENDNVLLSWYDSDLNLKIDKADFVTAKPISDSALALLYAGVRASYGVTAGKIAYEIQFKQENNVTQFSEEPYLHELRCGWSTAESDLQLGECPTSYGYSSVGKKISNNQFEDYGCKFKIEDVIGCYLDLDSTPCTIEFTVNSIKQGVAFEFNKAELNDMALFPHIVSKNVEFQVNFGQLEQSLLSNISKKNNNCLIEKTNVITIDDVMVTVDEGVNNALDVSESLNDDANENISDPPEEVPKIDETAVQPESTTQSEVETQPKEEIASEGTSDAGPTIIQSDEDQLIPEQDSMEEPNNDLPIVYDIIEGYQYIGNLPLEQRVRGPIAPEARADCEVIMMIGLPGSGKTHWVQKHVADNIEKRYYVLSTNNILKKMKIFNEPRAKNQNIPWERVLELTSRNIVALHDIASKRRRNYILDQTNVYTSAQERRMRCFGNFKRTAVVVIPAAEEYNRRYNLKIESEGAIVSEATLNEMKANFSFPTTGKSNSVFTEILFTDLVEKLAQEEVVNLNEKANAALLLQKNKRDFHQSNQKNKPRDRDKRGRWNNNNTDRKDNRRAGDHWQPMQNMSGWRGGSVREPGRGYVERYRNDRRWNNNGGGYSEWGPNRNDFRRNYDRNYNRSTSQTPAQPDRRDRRIGSGYDRDNRSNRSGSGGRSDYNRPTASGSGSGGSGGGGYRSNNYSNRDNRTGNRSDNKDHKSPDSKTVPWATNNNTNNWGNPHQANNQPNWPGDNSNNWNQSSWNQANTGGWKNYGQHNNMNSGSSNTEPANNQQWYPYYQQPPPNVSWQQNWGQYTQVQPSFNAGYNTVPTNVTGSDHHKPND